MVRRYAQPRSRVRSILPSVRAGVALDDGHDHTTAGVPALQRVDPGDRLTDYERALAFYLGLPTTVVDRVVFAENSDSDLSSLERLAERAGAGKDVEPPLLRRPRLSGRTRARGGGETRLIDTALERSRLLGALPADEPFWKVTGRLRFTNIDRLIATAPSGPELYIDFRRFPRRWVDIRIFACTPRTFRELFVAREPLMRQNELERSGYSAPEERLFEELLPLRERARVAPRLRLEPRVEGYSGHGHDYRASHASHLVRRARNPPEALPAAVDLTPRLRLLFLLPLRRVQARGTAAPASPAS